MCSYGVSFASSCFIKQLSLCCFLQVNEQLVAYQNIAGLLCFANESATFLWWSLSGECGGLKVSAHGECEGECATAIANEQIANESNWK